MLVGSLAATRLGRPLTPTEETAISLAIAQASAGPAPAGGAGAGRALGGARDASPTIPQVWAALRDPATEMARELRIRGDSADELREMTRPVTDALGAMVSGALAGLFDAPTTIRPDFDAPIQVIGLSRIADRGDEAVAMILACVSSWAQAAIDAPGPARMIIRDELWRSLRIPALLRKADSDLRLSRAHGTIQVLATHRLADFQAAGPAGSPEAAIAAGLVASCDTRVCLRQDTAPLADLAAQIGLTDAECAHISSWTARHAGRAVWKAGRTASAVVQLALTPAEQRLYWTNERMSLLCPRTVPPRAALTSSLADLIVLAAVTIAAIVTTWSWLTGQLAALLFGGHWPPVSVWQALAAAWSLPGHLSDPRQAWPASVRPQLPGPWGFLAAGTVSATGHRGHHHDRWAGTRGGNRAPRGFASRARRRGAVGAGRAGQGRRGAAQPGTARRDARSPTPGCGSGGPSRPGCRWPARRRTPSRWSPRPGRASPRQSSSPGCTPGPAQPSAPRSAPTCCWPPPSPAAGAARSR